MGKLLMPFAGKSESDQLIIQRRRIEKGQIYGLHWHNYFELEFILQGQGEHVYNDNTYQLQPGSAYLMSYYDFHSFRALTDIELVNIQFGEEKLSENLFDFIVAGGKRFFCTFNQNEMAYILSRIERQEAEKQGAQLFGEMLAAGMLAEIIVLLARKSNQTPTTLTPTLVQRAVTRIHTHFRSDISLAALAEEFSVSVNYLGSLFRKTTGMTFHDYLNMVRLKYACSLLVSSKMSVKEIAFESGYRSVEYFLYVFKRKLSMPPTGYRNQYWKDC